jgi:hypothetical protein
MLKGTKDGITIKCEVVDDILFMELALVVVIASVELVRQLGTIVRMGMKGSPDGTVTRCNALISRVSVRKDDSSLCVNIEVPVSDVQPVNELAEVGMGDPGVLIGVRVLAENEGRSTVEVRRDEAVCEALGEFERGLALETTESLGNGGRVGTEYSMRVNRTETE